MLAMDNIVFPGEIVDVTLRDSSLKPAVISPVVRE
jgi:hypothetical protein